MGGRSELDKWRETHTKRQSSTRMHQQENTGRGVRDLGWSQCLSPLSPTTSAEQIAVIVEALKNYPTGPVPFFARPRQGSCLFFSVPAGDLRPSFLCPRSPRCRQGPHPPTRVRGYGVLCDLVDEEADFSLIFSILFIVFHRFLFHVVNVWVLEHHCLLFQHIIYIYNYIYNIYIYIHIILYILYIIYNIYIYILYIIYTVVVTQCQRRTHVWSPGEKQHASCRWRAVFSAALSAKHVLP